MAKQKHFLTEMNNNFDLDHHVLKRLPCTEQIHGPDKTCEGYSDPYIERTGNFFSIFKTFPELDTS